MKPSATLRTGVVLGILLMAFVAAYAYFAPPGSSAQAPGWWGGWADQDRYLASARALVAGDYSRSLHFYPPLYPMLGALFLHVWPFQPFLIVDAVCFLFFAYGFIKFAERYVAWRTAVAIFALTVVFNLKIFEQFVTPWTTTPAAALIVCVMLLSRRILESNQANPWTLAGFGLAMGALIPLRPTDALVTLPFGVLILAKLFQNLMHAEGRTARRGLYAGIACLVLACSVGPGLFAWFNLATTGTLVGSYIQVASGSGLGSGLHAINIPEKFVSIFYSGQPLYVEMQSGILQHYPWVWFAGVGGLLALTNGPSELRALIIAMGIQLAIYLSYSDLLPSGLWRFNNIHYFKWMFPFWGLLGVLALKEIWRAARNPRRGLVVCAAVLLAGAGGALGLSVEMIPATSSVKKADGQTIVDVLPRLRDGDAVDYIDFYGARGGLSDTYFGHHVVEVDGRTVFYRNGYRLLPTSWGARLLFVTPVRGRDIRVQPVSGVSLLQDPAMVAAGQYSFRFGAPMWLAKSPGEFGAGAPYTLGETISFDANGNAAPYLGSGWAAPEPWGRRTVGRSAVLGLRVKGVQGAASLRAIVEAKAFLTIIDPRVRIAIYANGLKIGSRPFSEGKDEEAPSRWEVTIPAGVLKGNFLMLEFRVRSDSPSAPGYSRNPERLGLGLTSLTIVREASPALN